MSDYENELDRIRVKLHEETITMQKDEIIDLVNTHAQKIAREFGIRIVKETPENYLEPENTGFVDNRVDFV
jgi:hypothetical protein